MVIDMTTAIEVLYRAIDVDDIYQLAEICTRCIEAVAQVVSSGSLHFASV